MKTTQSSSNIKPVSKDAEVKHSKVEMMKPNEKDVLRRQSVDQIKFCPRTQSVPELRGLQKRPSVCYCQHTLPPISIPINQSELTNGKQTRTYTPIPPPAPYYRRLSQVYVPQPPQYYYVQRQYPQRLYYPYPPFPQRRV